MADKTPRLSTQPAAGEEAADAKRPSQEVRKSTAGGNERRKSLSAPGEPGAPASNEPKKSILVGPNSSGGGNDHKKSVSVGPGPGGNEPRKSTTPGEASGGEHKKSTAVETPLPPKPMKPRKSMLDQLLAEIPGNRPAAGILADKGARELSGKVHNYFATDDRLKEVEALKPLRRPKLVFDNTYRFSAYNPFHKDRVENVLNSTLEEMMVGVKYNAESGGETARKISEKIRARIMALHFDRYKIVVLTNIGPINRQGLHIGFRFLWDDEKDHYVHATHKNSYCFCTVAVYGVYFE